MLRWTLLAAAGCVTPASKATSRTSADTGSATTPVRVTDRFVVTAADQVDVLFVVETLATAGDWQASVAQSLPALVDPLIGVGGSYRLGVVSADPSDPLLHEVDGARWSEIPGTSTDLGALLGVGTTGTRASPALAVVGALGATENADFFRAGTPLHVVVVGSGVDDALPAELPPEGIAAWLRATRPDSAWHCVVPAGADPACASEAAQLDGVVGTTDALGEVGVRIAELPRSYPLSSWPLEDTLEVRVVDGESGAELAFGAADWAWEPVTNLLSFREYVPSPGADVLVSYVPAP